VLAAAVTLVWAQLPGQPRQLSLVLIDREGKKTPVGSLPADTFAPRISPDGKRIAYDTPNDGKVWIADIATLSSPRRATTGQDYYPMWSEDGRQILFTRGAAFLSFRE